LFRQSISRLQAGGRIRTADNDLHYNAAIAGEGSMMFTAHTRQISSLAALLALMLAGCGGDNAGSTTDSVAVPAEPDATTAQSGSSGSNAALPADDRPIVAETLPYAEVDEELVYGHFVFPADMVDPLPGILVVHERWGLDDTVRQQADKLAAQGYVVLAIDLYGGAHATDTDAARELMVDVVENPELANENIRQAYRFLEDSAQAPRIASLGWSFGGGWALNTALLLPDELDAVVVYYGQVTDNEERLEPLNAPLLGLFGELDRGVTLDSIESFEAALGRLRKDFEIEVFPDVGHAFADPSASNYDEEAAAEAWQRTLEFLHRHLVVDPA